MSRHEGREFHAADLVRRSRAALNRGDKPPDELLFQIEKWLDSSERSANQRELLRDAFFSGGVPLGSSILGLWGDVPRRGHP